MTMPDLTIGICTYRRPWYTVLCLEGFMKRFRYDGKIRFLISDGGSHKDDISLYRELLKDYETTVVVSNNLSSMINACAHYSGDIWMVTVDDYTINFSSFVNITMDVQFLLNHPEVGKIRLGRLAFWEGKNYGELVEQGGLHWWVLDKARTTSVYMNTVGMSIYHRRFWDAYGDIPVCRVHMPGEAEIYANLRFMKKDGPTIAIPMRFGEDCVEIKEPILHIGALRSTEYAKKSGDRFCAR
jgi:hypothetical protein